MKCFPKYISCYNYKCAVALANKPMRIASKIGIDKMIYPSPLSKSFVFWLILSGACGSNLVESLAQEAPSVTSLTWHTEFNKPVQIVEPGLTTDLTWNASSQLTQFKQTDTTSQTTPFSTNGRTRVWTYVYGTGGTLTSVDGPLAGTADTTSYTYTPQGYLKTTTSPLGQVVTITAWSPLGQPTSTIDANGLVTTYSYDGMGRITGIVRNPGSSAATWTFTYTAVGDLATFAEPLGAMYTLSWDDARRLTKIQNKLGEAVSYTRDAMGNVTYQKVADASGATVYEQTNTLDELGRLIKDVGGEGRTWTYGYDRTNNLTRVTDPRSKSMGFGFDAVNRLISETERDGGASKHAYNGKDEETTYTDPRNLATTYVRNGFGEVIQETSPDSGTTVYDYDARGLMISKKDARNVTVTYSYDVAGRLTGRSYPTAALNETFTYDGVASGNYGKGRLTRMKDAAGASDYTYDIQGRLVKEVRTIGTYAHTIGYTYDGPGRLYAITYPSGRTVKYDYDAMGRRKYVGLKRTSTAAEEVIVNGSVYLPFGWLRGMTFQNGLSYFTNWSWEYTLDGLFLAQQNGSPSLMERYHPRGDGVNLTKLNNDNIDATQTQTFTYDDAGRMLTAVGPYGSRTFTYDKVGNRLSEAKTVSGTTTSQTYAYPTISNRLSTVEQGTTTVRSFVYDAAGSQTSDTRSGTAYATIINNAGRIAQLSVANSVKGNYTYDGRNRLSIRQRLNSTPSGTTHLIHDAWDHVIVETNGAGQAVREYVWIDDLPVAVLDGSATPSNPTLLWVHVDHLRRPELMTDATKAIKWKAVYEPFGTVSSITGAAANDMRFPGQWFQLESGLAYNWYRQYDSTTGRYTQPDPLGLNQGPQAPAPSTILPSDAAPGMSLAANDNLADLSSIGTDSKDRNGLTTGLGYLIASQQGIYDLESHTGLADSAGASDPGKRIIRDGASLYAYAKQSPLMRKDPRGLLVGPSSSMIPDNLTKKCEEDCQSEITRAREICTAEMYNSGGQNITGGYVLGRGRYTNLFQCMNGIISQRCGGNAVRFRG